MSCPPPVSAELIVADSAPLAEILDQVRLRASDECHFRNASDTEPGIVAWFHTTSGNRHVERWSGSDPSWTLSGILGDVLDDGELFLVSLSTDRTHFALATSHGTSGLSRHRYTMTIDPGAMCVFIKSDPTNPMG